MLDVLIVLAVLCLLAGIFWRKELSEVIEEQARENTVSVTCTCTVVVAEDGEKIKLPEDICDVFYNGKKVGVLVSSVVTDESTDESAKQDLQEIAIKLSAVEEDSGYYINGAKLIIGEEYDFYTTMYEFTARIDDIIE